MKKEALMTVITHRKLVRARGRIVCVTILV